MVVKVLVDTNFLLYLFKAKIDLESMYLEDKVEIFVPESVIKELESLKSLKTKEGRLACVALRVIKSSNINIVKSVKNNVDEDLIVLAKTFGFVVASNDKNLRKKLKMNNIKTICIRNRKKVEVIE